MHVDIRMCGVRLMHRIFRKMWIQSGVTVSVTPLTPSTSRKYWIAFVVNPVHQKATNGNLLSGTCNLRTETTVFEYESKLNRIEIHVQTT